MHDLTFSHGLRDDGAQNGTHLLIHRRLHLSAILITQVRNHSLKITMLLAACCLLTLLKNPPLWLLR